MSKRQCLGTNKKGKPCGCAPLKGEDYCSSHDRTRSEEDRFGSPIWSAKAGASPKPSVPKPMELALQIVEAHAEEFLNPYLRALGLELRDGELYRLESGGAKVTASWQGEVTASELDDLAAQQATVERLIDRLWGRPTQATEISGPGGGPVEVGPVDLSKLSVDELKQLRGLLERAGEPADG